MPSLTAPGGRKDNELKANLEGNKLDLSLMQYDALSPAFVRQIFALPKATEVDLSCNRLQNLPSNFASLTQITHLDLSKNQITELPEEIGQMTGLRHLDLSGNKIVSLPLSFGELEHLRWLDLKDNPLETHLAAVSGDCLDKKQCMNAAKQVCVYMRTLAEAHEKVLEKKKKKKENLEEKKQRKKEEKEKLAREEQKAAKKLEREKKRREYEEKKPKEELVETIGPMGDRRDTDSEAEAELRRRRSTRNSKSSSFFSALVAFFVFLFRLTKLVFLLLLVSTVVASVLVGWCQGPRRGSPVCGATRDVVVRVTAKIPAASNFDFDVFCDSMGNRTRELLLLANIKLGVVHEQLRPLIEKVSLFYEERISPHLLAATSKGHCLFCDARDVVSGFFREHLLPAVNFAWTRASAWTKTAVENVAASIEKHVVPTLIVVRDHVVEVYLVVMEHVIRVCDLYVFPGCQQILASAANVYHNLKPDSNP